MRDNTVKNRGDATRPHDIAKPSGAPNAVGFGWEGGHTEAVSDPAYAPVLSPTQVERVRSFAQLRQVQAGQVLYEPGEDTPPVYVVLSGRMRIFARTGGREQVVTSYGAGQFSGELLMIAGRKSIYRCQAIEAGTL